ncbi:MAG: pyridoxamine 5'-phosphate oxidase family protein [Chloroflexota bacterium]|jgi:DNA-binding IclR family transcriptional regulator/nitroimidazol reductase NimA-like FMN-containing flavoprotein (pyridoxamine 5'-phosphate oxidase superfamily)
MNKPDSLTTTAERTLRLVELLFASPEGLSPQDILPRLGISRSSLFILLRTLKALGYVEQAERRGRYRPGARLMAWRFSSGETHQSLLDAFYQEARNAKWSETLLVAVPAPQGELVLAQVESPQTVRSAYQVGEVTTGLAACRAVLHAQPDDAVLTGGYALALNAQTIELALPVCADGIRPQAAVMLTAPAFRWEKTALLDTWLAELRALAARLSYRIGALVYTPYQVQRPADLPPEIQLTPAEINRFLQAPWTARLACLRPDGKPHVIPVWQEWDGKAFHLIAWEGSLWAEFLRANPEVSLTIDEPWPPLRRVTARGKAVALPYEKDDPRLSALISRLSIRYLGEASLAPASGQVTDVFQIQPETLRGWKGLLPASPRPL